MYKVLIEIKDQKDPLYEAHDRRIYVPFLIWSYKNLIKELYSCGEDEPLHIIVQLKKFVRFFKEMEILHSSNDIENNSYLKIYEYIHNKLPILQQKFKERKTFHLREEEEWIRKLELQSTKYPW